MPQAIADGEQPAPVLAREGCVVLVEVGDVGEGRGQARLIGRPQAGADGVLDVAQALGEGELLGVVDLLVVEYQHGIPVHAGVDRRHLVRCQRLAHVDALDFAREAGPDLADGDCHRSPPFPSRLDSQRNGENFAGTAKVLVCLCRTTPSPRGGGHWPGFIAEARRRSRSPMFL